MAEKKRHMTNSTYAYRPLFGRRVAVTRAQNQSGEMVSLLQDLGAEILEAPTIEIAAPADWAPVDRAIEMLETFDWVVFSSANGVAQFLDRVRSVGRDPGILNGVSVAAVGPATAEKVVSCGGHVDLCPDRRLAEGMVEAFAAQGDIPGKRFLIPRPETARSTLSEGLRKMGGQVQEVVVYRTVCPRGLPAEVLDRLVGGKVDLVSFTSASTAKNFAGLLGSERLETVRRQVVAACIGPETARAACEMGFRVVAEPDQDEISIPGLVRAIVTYFKHLA